MKLLLTSAGITNKLIKDALLKLLDKPPGECSAILITTAANAEPGDKDWLIKDINSLYDLGFKSFDMLDIAGLNKQLWLKRVYDADLLIFSGGNTFHLMRVINQQDFAAELNQLISNKIYMGISAGSLITGPDLTPTQSKDLYAEEEKELSGESLNWVNFYVRPHLNSAYFTKVTPDNVKILSEKLNFPVYALDDQSAVLVDGNNTSVISLGEWYLYNH